MFRTIRRIVLLVAAAAAVLAAGAASASAAGQAVCIGGPGQQVTTPNASGNCAAFPGGRAGTLVTLATEDEVSTLQGQVSTLQGQVSTLQGQVSTLQGQVSTLQGQVSTLQSDVSSLQDKLSNVTFNATGLNGKPTLTVSGANLQIVNGEGSTNTNNGLGNLFIGYDEYPGGQTGSHNLVLGEDQAFSSYGGLVAGNENTLTRPFEDAFGFDNTVSGWNASVSGGRASTASADYSAISGGYGNLASGNGSSVSGGNENTASGPYGSILGGQSNTVSGYLSSILGGKGNTVSTDCGTFPDTGQSC